MSVKKIFLILAITLISIVFTLQFVNEKSKAKLAHSYCDNKYQENIEVTYNGIMYSYHHYFTDNTSKVIFNQDVSGVFLRVGHYYLTYPFKQHCYSGCELGISLPETSLFNVFYKQTLNDKHNSTLIFLPERGIAIINEHKLVLSSLLLNEY